MTKQEIGQKAHDYNLSGGYMCSEAVVKALSEGLKADIPREVIAASSLFGGGMGSGCTCGALIGATLYVGAVRGRKEINEPSPLMLSKELHDYFKSENGSTCCRVLTHKFDKSRGEHKPQCAKFVRMMAEKTVEMIER